MYYFVPLYVKERFDGFIAGVLNYQKFLVADTISSHYAISVYEGDKEDIRPQRFRFSGYGRPVAIR